MTLIRTVEPAVEPVTLVEAKDFLRVASASDDDLLTGLIRAAREDVERTTGLALIDQTWRLAVDCLPRTRVLAMPRHPVKEIVSVTVYGEDGEATITPADGYLADLMSRPARLYFEAGLSPARAMNGIEVDFRAGFGEAGSDVPDLLKRAILTLAAHWYEFRASYGPDDQPVSYPPHYDRMIASYRDRRL